MNKKHSPATGRVPTLRLTVAHKSDAYHARCEGKTASSTSSAEAAGTAAAVKAWSVILGTEIEPAQIHLMPQSDGSYFARCFEKYTGPWSRTCMQPLVTFKTRLNYEHTATCGKFSVVGFDRHTAGREAAAKFFSDLRGAFVPVRDVALYDNADGGDAKVAAHVPLRTEEAKDGSPKVKPAAKPLVKRSVKRGGAS